MVVSPVLLGSLMDQSILIPMAVGVAVITVFSVLGFVLSKSVNAEAEQRLDGMTGSRISRPKVDAAGGILLRPPAIDLGQPAFWTRLIPNADNLNKLYEQADVSLAFTRFMMIVAGMAVSGGVAALVLQHAPVPGPASGRPCWGSCRFSGSCTGRSGGSRSSSTRCPRRSSWSAGPCGPGTAWPRGCTSSPRR